MSKRIKPLPMPDCNQALTAELLGQVIRAKRTQDNLRLEDAAALCGVAKQTFMKIEHGEQTSQVGSILKICMGLGIKLRFSPWQNESEADDVWY